jgi:catechol 2,3-dioxygenase-like lactoylglutathione lyase family enzyme
MIRGIKFVNVPVRNQKEAVKFYTEKLGFRVVVSWGLFSSNSPSLVYGYVQEASNSACSSRRGCAMVGRKHDRSRIHEPATHWCHTRASYS